MTYLSRRGIECIAVCYSNSSGNRPRRSLEQEGVKLFYFDIPAKNHDAHVRTSRVSAISKLHEIIKEGDVLLTIFLPEKRAWGVARSAGAKVIQKYTLVYDGFDALEEWNNAVDMHIFNSGYCRGRWQEMGVEGLNMVIYPEVDFRVDASSYPGDGCIGMINPTRHKGLEIFEKLSRAFPSEHFLAAGGWALGNEGYHSDSSPIEYMKHMNDISSFYKRLKVLLVPTQDEHTETFGRAVLEAMFYGVPVIASNKDGIPEAADGAAMLIDDYGAVEPWMSALRVMLKRDMLEKYHRLSVQRSGRYFLDTQIYRWHIAIRLLHGDFIDNDSDGCKEPKIPS